MIVDSSAIIAILKDEPEAQRFTQVLEQALDVKMSLVNYVEAGVVADSAKNPLISRQFDELIRVMDVELVPLTFTQARLAREAYRDFGRGSGHPAALNFGDCFSYALAKETGEPLLYKGLDFAATDVDPA